MLSRFFVDYLGDFGCCCAKRFHDQDMQTDPEVMRRLPVYLQKSPDRKLKRTITTNAETQFDCEEVFKKESFVSNRSREFTDFSSNRMR